MFDLNRISEAVRSEGGLSRRLFLAYGSALAALPAIAARTSAADRKVAFSADPFALGVASGDPDATGALLWTKLAPKPADPDGGMKPEAVPVRWEVASDETMKTIVATGTSIATPQLGHSVHAEVRGLKPDRWYWYRYGRGRRQPDRPHAHAAGARCLAGPAAVRVRILPALRTRAVHRVRADGAGRSRSGVPPRRLHLRIPEHR